VEDFKNSGNAYVDDEGEMSPKIKSVEYLAVGAGTVFDPPTNDLIYILHICRTCFYVYPGRNHVR
jgi:hypothetical protein